MLINRYDFPDQEITFEKVITAIPDCKVLFSSIDLPEYTFYTVYNLHHLDIQEEASEYTKVLCIVSKEDSIANENLEKELENPHFHEYFIWYV
jgi:hypothetical protein